MYTYVSEGILIDVIKQGGLFDI